MNRAELKIIRTEGRLRIVERVDRCRAIQRRHWFKWRLINFGPFGPYSWGPNGSHVWLSEKFYLDTSMFNILEDRWTESMQYECWSLMYG
jgi:hypothetical protein